MVAGGIDLQEFTNQAELASTAGAKITTTVDRNRLLKRFGQSLWAFVKPYWAVLSIVERALDSGVFDRKAFQNLHDRALRLEHIADDVLADARTRGDFNRTSMAAALLSLQACNERIKDCMVAIESMLDPNLDDVMAAALEEHRKGETVPLDSLS